MFGKATFALAGLALTKAEGWREYVKMTGETALVNGEEVPCDTTLCQEGKCQIYMYDNGGGFMYLESCNETDAIEEARDEYKALQMEAASDDIGQLILQLEAVLEARGRASSAGCNGNVLCRADGENINEHGCACMCKCKTNDMGGTDCSESECQATSGVAMHNQQEIGIIRRFKNLKAMVMTMQPVNVTVFGRYCYYGCWCLPNGQHNLAAGYGQPVDPIDEVCKEFALCYKCLEMDFAGECDPEKRAYRWGRVRDNNGVTYDLSCKDNHERGPVHRCKRYTCECDRVLAMGLHYTHWYWNESHHARWGGFDREASCANECTDCAPQNDCCGAYGAASTEIANPLTRRPYSTDKPNAGCCQDVYYYNTQSQECCIQDDNVSVEEVGTCQGSVIDPDEVDDFDAFSGLTRK